MFAPPELEELEAGVKPTAVFVDEITSKLVLPGGLGLLLRLL
jgi:hypothetical protein